MRAFILSSLAAIFVFFGSLPAFAQEEEKSTLIKFVEEQLSADNRRISLNGLEGTLSSNVSLDSITISDEQGVWLRIVKPQLVWNRTALLRGRVEIESLTAEKIDYPRGPVADESLPDPEAGSFALPELPVAIVLEKLDIAEIDIGEAAFGQAARIALTGSIKLDDGQLETDLKVDRLDNPGAFAIKAAYGGDPATVDATVSLTEPKGGIVAALLNLPGEPSVSLAVNAKGPVNDLDATLTFDVDGERILDGNLDIAQAAEGLRTKVRLDGPLSKIMTEDQRPFFGDNSRLDADILIAEDGRILVERALLDSGATQLTATAATLKDGFLSALDLDLRLRPVETERLLLPGQGARISLASAGLRIDYDVSREQNWTATLEAKEVQTGDIGIGSTLLEGKGTVTNAQDPQTRSVTYALEGNVLNLKATDENLQKALGDSIALIANGDWTSGSPVTIEKAEVTGDTLDLEASGTLDLTTFDGTIDLQAGDLSAFSGLAERPLAGSANISTRGKIFPVSGGFDLTLDGTARDLKIGDPRVDKLLSGETRLEGGVARSEEGLAFNNFRLRNEQLQFTANGRYSSELASLRAQARLADLGDVLDNAAGRTTADLSIEGQEKPYRLSAQIGIPDGRLSGREVDGLRMAFDGTTDTENLRGELSGSGRIGGESVDLAGAVDVTPGLQSITGLDARVGATRLSGNMARGKDNLLEGKVQIASRDISAAAALASVEASGAIDGTVELTKSEDGKQSGSLDVDANGLRYQTYRLGRADIEAAFNDLFGTPKVDAKIDASDLAAAGIDVRTLDGTVETQGDTTTFDISAALRQNEARVAASGRAIQREGETIVELVTLTVDSDIADAKLEEPSTVTLRGEDIAISDTRLTVGGGDVRVSGNAGQRLDLSLAIDQLPLAIANAIKPDLALGGTLSGTAQVTGTAQKPNADFKVNGSGITARQLSEQGITPLDVAADGRFADDVVVLQSARLRNGQGLNASASGRVPLSGGTMDVDISLQQLPLAIANGIRPELGLGGNISGTAKIGGTISDPQASFDLNGSGVTAAQLQQQGIQPIQFSANGRFADNAVQLSGASVRNGQGIDLNASGRVPFSGAGLQLSIDGGAPLDLAEAALADRGASLSGQARVNMTVTGALANPQIDGLVSVSGGTLTDPLSNLQLTNIGLVAGLNGDRLTLRDARAQLATGGSVSASGFVMLDAGMEANISVILRDAVYTDGETFRTKASGNLALTGSLAANPLLSGEVNLDRTEIAIPESFGGSDKLLDVTHVQPPPRVVRTLSRLERVRPKGTPQSRPSVLRLDVVVNAPNQIFVRGRGIDAELGGRVRITGPVTDVQPVGRFELRRGRISIVGQRIDLTEGTIVLTGSLNPLIDFTAVTKSDTVEAIIKIEGRVSDPEITFSSVPELPQDEVLAQIVFGRSIGELSPIQIAKLASIAAELTGGNSPGLIDGLRQGTGLDDLDVVTDSDGNAAVKAGKYISDNVYLGVQAGAKSQATINLDITDNLTARGAVDSEANSSIGVFFEKDY